MIKRTLYTLVFCLFTSMVFSQARVVINNNGYVVIDNSAYVVLANPNPNALTTIGTGGNIVSEAETDVVQWEIGTTTGTYTIPWTTNSGVKIPLTINKTTAGTGATAEFVLSTWETATDLNIPIPSAVNNMNYNGVDRSLFVMDRFWHIDALSYAAKPDVTLTINYDPSANEMGGTNTITESNLLAQRFNTGLNHWESYNLYGTNDAGNDRVTNITIPSADFFEDWILVDATNPLPVELISFDATCNDSKVELNWVTASEINNDYFIVEKSYDAVNYFELTTIKGNGNSNKTNYYSSYDMSPSNGVTYYRLKQVDYNSGVNYHNTVSVNCNANEFEVTQWRFNTNSLTFNVSTTIDENLTIFLYDYSGKLVESEFKKIYEGNNLLRLNNLNLASGIYLLSIVGEFNSYSIKLHSKGNN